MPPFYPAHGCCV